MSIQRAFVVPCSLLFFQVENYGMKQVYSCWTPPHNFYPRSTKPPDSSTLSATLFEQVRHQQCSYQTTRLSLVSPPSLPLHISQLLRSAFQDHWRISELVCWDKFSLRSVSPPPLVLHLRMDALLKAFPDFTLLTLTRRSATKWAVQAADHSTITHDLRAVAVQLR